MVVVKRDDHSPGNGLDKREQATSASAAGAFVNLIMPPLVLLGFG